MQIFTYWKKRIHVWQLSIVHLATKCITRIVFYFYSLKYVGINVDRRYHHSVRTWKTREKSNFGEKVLKLVRLWIKKFQGVRFWNKISTTRPIWFEIFLQRVNFWIEKKCNALGSELNNFAMRRILKKKFFFKKHEFEEKKYFWEAQF